MTSEQLAPVARVGFSDPLLARNGFECAFASWPERVKMLNAFDRDVPAILARS